MPLQENNDNLQFWDDKPKQWEQNNQSEEQYEDDFDDEYNDDFEAGNVIDFIFIDPESSENNEQSMEFYQEVEPIVSLPQESDTK